MNKDFPSIYKKAKVAILMLCLFLMVVNTCPVLSLMTIDSLPNIEYSKQSIGAKIFVNDDLLCSEGQVTNAVLLDFSKSYNSNLPFPFILSVLNLYLFLSVLSTKIR